MTDFWDVGLVEELKETQSQDSQVRVYLAGPCRDYSASQRVRQSLVEKFDNYAYIKPVDPIEKKPDVREDIPPTDVSTLSECDVVLLYHVPGVESWGTPAEIYLAAMAGYPIFLWEVDGEVPQLSVWLESAIDESFAKADRALSACLSADI